MNLTSLILKKYRNYESLKLEFDPGKPLTSIIGPNAHGKTNILEAIYLLALTKSFRTNKQQDLIKWGEDFCRITGKFDLRSPQDFVSRKDFVSLEVFYGIDPNPKKALKINGVKTSSIKFIGNCQIVFFHPEDLNILYLGPDLRRKYLDILNVQVSSKYYSALRTYKRILQQRNALLRRIKEGIASPADLQIWNEQLAEQGEIIISERQNTIQFLNEKITEMYRKIAQKDDDVEIKYICSSQRAHGASAQGAGSPRLELSLKETQERDIQAQVTTIGPHRDDIEFLLNERPLASHASRGEYRSILLTIKLLELNFYEEKTGEKPLLLLDDVFSELDQDRQQHLLENIEGCQTILTTTHTETHLFPREHKGIHTLELKKSSGEPKSGIIAMENKNKYGNNHSS